MRFYKALYTWGVHFASRDWSSNFLFPNLWGLATLMKFNTEIRLIQRMLNRNERQRTCNPFTSWTSLNIGITSNFVFSSFSSVGGCITKRSSSNTVFSRTKTHTNKTPYFTKLCRIIFYYFSRYLPGSLSPGPEGVDEIRGRRQMFLQNPPRDRTNVSVLKRIFNRYYCMHSQKLLQKSKQTWGTSPLNMLNPSRSHSRAAFKALYVLGPGALSRFELNLVPGL